MSNMKHFYTDFKTCCDYGLHVLSQKNKETKDLDDVIINVWEQMWDSSSCGFDTVGFDMMTKTYTIIVVDRYWKECVVFHDMKYAYHTEITEEVRNRIKTHNLQGAYDFLTKN